MRQPLGTTLAHAALIGALAAGLCGCQSLRDWQARRKFQPKYVVSVHLLARPGVDEGRLIRRVAGLDGGREVRVRHVPVLSTYGFPAAEPVVEGETATAIAFTLDGHGRMAWMQTTAEHPGEEVAVLVDGFFRFLWRLPGASEGDRLVIRGPWDRREAELIAEYTPANYDRLHSR